MDVFRTESINACGTCRACFLLSHLVRGLLLFDFQRIGLPDTLNLNSLPVLKNWVTVPFKKHVLLAALEQVECIGTLVPVGNTAVNCR